MSAEGEQKEEVINSIEEDKDLLVSSSEPEANDEHVLTENDGEALNDEQDDNKESLSTDADASPASKESDSLPANETELEPIPAEQVEANTETPKSVEPEEPVQVVEPVEEEKTEEQTKEQARLKKLEEARKKIERLKSKKNINNQQSKDSTPVKEDSLNKHEVPEANVNIDDDKISELQGVIAKLNQTIKEKDSEIVKLKAELIKERQLNKDLQSQIKTPSSASIAQPPVSYENIDFDKWKNFKIDMSEWRSIGSGPIVQF